MKLNHNVKPEWYDEERFMRGQAFFKRHEAALGMVMHCGVLAEFSIKSVVEPLVFNDVSTTPMGAYKRYGYARCHILNWMTSDLWDKTSEAYRSITSVRGVHLKVARNIGLDHKEHVCETRFSYIIENSQSDFLKIINQLKIVFLLK